MTWVPASHVKRALSVREIAGMLDLLVLSPDTSAQGVADACTAAARAHLATVYVSTPMVTTAASELAGSAVGVGTVVAGLDVTDDPSVTLSAARRVVEEGATEVAVIVGNHWWRSNGDAALSEQIRGIADLTAGYGAALKVVFLTGELDEPELVRGCHLAEHAGARILQGGSWFTADRSTMGELQLMRASTSPAVIVKGAGYIKSLDLLLVGYAHGLGRFNVHRVDRLLADAVHRSEGGDILVPPANDLHPHVPM